jgi:hypothetical protein
MSTGYTTETFGDGDELLYCKHQKAECPHQTINHVNVINVNNNFTNHFIENLSQINVVDNEF